MDNAIEACIANVNGRHVSVTYDQQGATLIVEDNGTGIEADRVADCFSLGHSERSQTNIENAAKYSDKFDARSNVCVHSLGALTICLCSFRDTVWVQRPPCSSWVERPR